MRPDRYLRTFDVLNLLVEHNEGLRLTEIKDALGLAASSVHNMLKTMVAAEVLTVSDGLRYSVGPRTMTLALRTLGSVNLRNVSRPFLQALARKVGDDVYLGIQVGRRVMYVDRCLGTQHVSLDIRLGEPLFLHATAVGKLLTAFDATLKAEVLCRELRKLTPHTLIDIDKLERELEHIRSVGYAKSMEEAVEGIVGYAVPIRRLDGAVGAAIHVSVLTGRLDANHESQLLEAAQDCAQQIERQLGYEPS